MIWLSRSDSRVTMSTSVRCSSLRVVMPDRTRTEPAMELSGLRISWAIPAAIRPTALKRSRMRTSRSSRRISVRSAKL